MTTRVQWIPEDDLLLKNAIEGGASLEALAKGAVQFSRRFTLRELRERWHSLLYDPDISAQASAQMIELEFSGFNSSSKLNKTENNLKGNKETKQKRKIESIRKHYYAMRKKARSEFFGTADLGFFDPHPHDCGGQGTAIGLSKHVILDNDPQNGNLMLGNCITDNLGLQEEVLDMLRHALPETMKDIGMASGVGDTSNPYQTGFFDPVENNHPNGIAVKKGRSHFSEVIETNEKSSCILRNCSMSSAEGLVDDSSLPRGSSNDIIVVRSETKHFPDFEMANKNLQDASFGNEAGEEFKSLNSEGSFSFQAIGFPSNRPNLPPWKTTQDVSATPVPVGNSGVNAVQGSVKMIPHDGGAKKNFSMYTGVRSGSVLNDGDITGCISSSTVSEGEFADPDSLLNLSNEDDILLVDEDGKGGIDKSSPTTLDVPILDAASDVQGHEINKTQPETVKHSESCAEAACDASSSVLEVASSSVSNDQQSALHSGVDVASRTMPTTDLNEFHDGNICCVLNTEDTEIPCNDDIFLLIHPNASFGSSPTRPINTNSTYPSSVKDDGQLNNLPSKAKSFALPEKLVPNTLPRQSPGQPLVDYTVNSKLSDSKRHTLLPESAGKVLEHTRKNRLLNAIPRVSDDRHPEKDVAGTESRGGDGPLATLEMAQGGSAGVAVPESEVGPLMSDVEECQSDDDVPYFSDVEAMILEMDLDPYDQVSGISRQVASYQYDDTKKTIMRLEQCARSCLHRHMTSRGALAIIYGRHLKYYIDKPEVVLGRSTHDVDVDIDLRNEGRASKISRRQAIIKMKENGSFLIRNIGKSPLFVNGVAAATGKVLALQSSCLIEVGGMSFVFEINQNYVKRFGESIVQKSKGKNIKFNSLPKREA